MVRVDCLLLVFDQLLLNSYTYSLEPRPLEFVIRGMGRQAQGCKRRPLVAIQHHQVEAEVRTSGCSQ